MIKTLALAMTLAACAPLMTDDPDTSVDTASIDLVATWTYEVAVPGDSACIGADGTDPVFAANGDLYVVTGCEQSSTVARGIRDHVTGLWSHSTTGGNGAAEAAKLGDLDGTGLAVVSAGQNKDIKIDWFNGTHTTLSLAHNDQQWQALALADVDGDGDLDIIAGGTRAAAPAAHVKWYGNPGAATSHTGSAWLEHDVGTTGQTMSILPLDADGDGDLDMVVSERSWIWNGTAHDNSKFGVHWYEQTFGPTSTFVDHQILVPAHGEPKMAGLYDWDGDGDLDVLWTASNSSWNLSGIAINGGSFGQFTFQDVAQPDGVGQVHGVAAGPINADCLPDLVYVYAEAYDDGLSGIVWLRNDQHGDFTRGEVGGDDGDKYDDVQLVDADGDGDLDLVTSEQHEADPPSSNTTGQPPGLGARVYLNPRI